MSDLRRQITRTRTTYSCQNCRKRKIKCTKTHPSCKECLRNNEKCIYDTNERGTSLQDGPYKRKSEVVHIEVNDEAQSNTPAVNRPDELRSILDRLDAIIGTATDLATQAPRNKGDIGKETNSAHMATESDLDPLSAISAKVEKLQVILKSRPEEAPDVKSSCSEASIQEPIKRPRTGQNTDLRILSANEADFEFSLIPTREQSNVLFRKWLSFIYPVLPITDPVEALIKYESFHQWHSHGLEKGIPNPMRAFMPMIFAIHYSGTVCLTKEGLQRWWPGVSRRVQLGIAQDHFQQCIRSSGYNGRSALAAKVIMRHLCHDQENSIQAGVSLAAIVRGAQALGLHRQPSRNGRIETGECDHRLWSEIINLDVALSSSTNLPPLTNEHYYDTTFPYEIKEIRNETIEAVEHEAQLRLGGVKPSHADDPQTNSSSSLVSVYYIVSRARALLASTTRKLNHVCHKVRPLTKGDMIQIRSVLGDVESEIKAVIERIPCQGVPEYDFAPGVDIPGEVYMTDRAPTYGEKLTLSEVIMVLGDEPIREPHLVPHLNQLKRATIAFHKWARIYLSAMIDQIHSLSYGPFMRNLKSKLWLVARQCLLKHCHSFMRKYIALATNRELYSLRWTWTSLLQPMHSTLLLLLDTYERPYSHEAARSRALVDRMLSLTLARHEIVKGDDGMTSRQPLDECGQEARSLLMDLRSKSWQKARLDPTVLWTEEDQILVGVAKAPTNSDLFARSMREDTIHESLVEGSSTSQEALRAQYRRMVTTVGGELRHPSEAGVLPDTMGPISHSFELSKSLPHPMISELLRTPHFQEFAPLHKHQQAIHVPEAHATSMDGISRLLQTIKEEILSGTDPRDTVNKDDLGDNQEVSHSEPRMGLTANRADTLPKPARDVNSQPPTTSLMLDGLDQDNASHHSAAASVAMGHGDMSGRTTKVDPTESGDGHTHSESSFVEPSAMDFDFDFDWEHWDSVFVPLDDGGFDVMEMVNDHVDVDD